MIEADSQQNETAARDAFADLIDALKRGGGKGGDGDGSGHGDGDGSGDFVTVAMLLDAVRQMGKMQTQSILFANARLAAQATQQDEFVAKELSAPIARSLDMLADLAERVADLGQRVVALERASSAAGE
jgi:hypothetical protein